jgi:hypothetical protein
VTGGRTFGPSLAPTLTALMFGARAGLLVAIPTGSWLPACGVLDPTVAVRDNVRVSEPVTGATGGVTVQRTGGDRLLDAQVKSAIAMFCHGRWNTAPQYATISDAAR